MIFQRDKKHNLSTDLPLLTIGYWNAYHHQWSSRHAKVYQQ